MVVPVKLPSFVFAVIVYTPAGTASFHNALPNWSTLNPFVIGEIAYVTFLSVALAGVIAVANNLSPAAPATALYVSGVNATPVTGIVTPPPPSGKLGQ